MSVDSWFLTIEFQAQIILNYIQVHTFNLGIFKKSLILSCILYSCKSRRTHWGNISYCFYFQQCAMSSPLLMLCLLLSTQSPDLQDPLYPLLFYLAEATDSKDSLPSSHQFTIQYILQNKLLFYLFFILHVHEVHLFYL